MAQRGRKSAYEEYIVPNFEYIKEQLGNGAKEAQIADSIGVSVATWEKYKSQKPEFRELIKKSRQNLVTLLRGALVKKALGFEYQEEKIYVKTDTDGKEKKHMERFKKYSPPDVAALNLCLKNYDKENWSNDPQADRFKEQELELKKMRAELDDW